MIKSFRHKGLSELWAAGKSGKIDARPQKRILIRLDAMHKAKAVGSLMVVGFNFHPLKGFEPTRYSIHVNGPWCITFEFPGTDAEAIDLEQYH